MEVIKKLFKKKDKFEFVSLNTRLLDWQRENEAYIKGYKQGKEEGERLGLYKRYTPNQLRELIGLPTLVIHSPSKHLREITKECISSFNKGFEKGSKCCDNVNHPSHYETEKYKCIEVMIETQGIEATKQFCKCNVFKYLWRANKKNGLEDIKKAHWYLNKYIELEEQKE